MRIPATSHSALTLLLFTTSATACLRTTVCWVPQSNALNNRIVISEIKYDSALVCGSVLDTLPVDEKMLMIIGPGANIVPLAANPSDSQSRVPITCQPGLSGSIAIVQGKKPGETAAGVSDEYADLRINRGGEEIQVSVSPNMKNVIAGMEMVCGELTMWQPPGNRLCTDEEHNASGFVQEYYVRPTITSTLWVQATMR